MYAIIYYEIDNSITMLEYMTKLRIDLLSGILEVEGEEAFVREIYKEYKDKFTRADFSPVEETTLTHEAESHPARQIRKKGGSSKSMSKRKESYQIVKDLVLSAKNEKESLRDFYSKKAPSTGLEKSAVFVYYLQKVAGVKDIGVNHMYTCYKDVNEKVPGALRQSLVDTSARKGWIDTKSMDNITITTHGENLVEHELPREIKKK